MDNHRGSIWWFVLLLALAAAVQVYPLEPAWRVWRPDAVLMVLFYAALAMPLSVSVGLAWLAGIFLDSLLATSLGSHAFALAVVVYGVQMAYHRVMMYSALQQAAVVLVLVIFHLGFVAVVQAEGQHRETLPEILAAALASAWLWPVCRWFWRPNVASNRA